MTCLVLQGDTALILALEGKHSGTAEMLVKAGADMTAESHVRTF